MVKIRSVYVCVCVWFLTRHLYPVFSCLLCDWGLSIKFLAGISLQDLFSVKLQITFSVIDSYQISFIYILGISNLIMTEQLPGMLGLGPILVGDVSCLESKPRRKSSFHFRIYY